MLKVKSGRLCLDETDVDYIRFGSGVETLIMLPGLGDGLHTVRGTALLMSLLYHKFGKKYSVYMLSRKNKLPAGYSTNQMAEDVFRCMKELGIAKAHVMGVSMGGMIAQHLAAMHPGAVEKLVLVVTCPGLNTRLNSTVRLWMSQARARDHRALMDSNLRFIYSPEYYKANKAFTPIVGMITKPETYERFLVQAEACLSHDAHAQLPLIKNPTLIIGGEKDKTLGVTGSQQLHEFISGSELFIYPNGYHGLYEEEKDFPKRVLEFLEK